MSFLTTAYLLRTLGPVPFGIVAMAAAMFALLSSLAEAGIGASLVSDPKLSPRRISAALLSSAALAGALLVFGVVAAPWIVWFYGEPDVAVPWVVMTALAFPSLLSAVPLALGQREQRFARIAGIQIVAALVAAGVAIGVAQELTDYTPLLARHAAVALTTALLVGLLLRPTLARPRREDFAEIARFSRGIVSFQLLNTLARRADDILIGRFLGDRALGLYDLAYRILVFPLDQMSGVFGVIAYPRLARRAPDMLGVARHLSRVMRTVAVFSTPFCIGVAIAAPEVIVVLFGPEWLESLVPFRALVLLGVYQAPVRLLGLTYQVSRQTGAMARWAAFSVPILVLSFVVGLPWGIGGVAISYAVASVALGPLLFRHAARTLGVPSLLLARGALAGIGWGLLAAAPVAVACLAARASGFAPAEVLAATVVSGALVEMVLFVVLRHTDAEVL